MKATLKKTEYKNLNRPDETRTFSNGKMELVNLAEGTIGRMTLHPGWRWSNDVKPLAGTKWCEAPHFQYIISGTLHVCMEDGQEFDLTSGDVASLPSGHDAWVVGSQPVIAVDWYGATDYAKQK